MPVLKMKPTLNGEGGQGGGSQLYLHNIQIMIRDTNHEPVTTTIISQSSTPMTTTTLLSWLKQNNFTINDQADYDGTQKYYNASGIAQIGTQSYISFAVGIVCFIDDSYGEEYIGTLSVEPDGTGYDIVFRGGNSTEVVIDTVIAL